MRPDKSDVIRVMLWKRDQDGNATLVKEHILTGELVCFSPDLSTIALTTHPSSGPASVELWDMAHCTKRHSFNYREHHTPLKSLSFEGNRRILVAKSEGDERRTWQRTLWDVTSIPKEIGTFCESDVLQWTHPLVSPTGDWVATWQETGFIVRKLSTRENGRTLWVPSDLDHWMPLMDRPLTGSFSPDGTLLSQSVSYRKAIPIWSKWLPDVINPFAQDRDGIMVAMWDVAAGSEVQLLHRRCWSVFSTDGRWFATTNYPKKDLVEIWNLPIRKPFLGIVIWSLASWLSLLSGVAVVLKVRKRRKSHGTVPAPATATESQPQAFAGTESSQGGGNA